MDPLNNRKGQMIEDDRWAVEVFHHFFRSVFVSGDVDSIPEFNDMANSNIISHVTVTPNEILAELKQLSLTRLQIQTGYL